MIDAPLVFTISDSNQATNALLSDSHVARGLRTNVSKLSICAKTSGQNGSIINHERLAYFQARSNEDDFTLWFNTCVASTRVMPQIKPLH